MSCIKNEISVFSQRPPHEKGPMKELDDEPTFKDMAYNCAKEVAEKTATIEGQEEELSGVKRKLKEVVNENRKVAKKLEKNGEKLKHVRDKKKKEHDSLFYHRREAEKARDKVIGLEEAKGLVQQLREVQQQLEEVTRKCTDLESEMVMLREVLDEKEKEIEQLEEEREPIVDMMEGRQYKPELVELVWELLDENVAQGRIPSLITKCGKLFKKGVKRLPTRKTIADMNFSRLTAGQKHMKVQRLLHQCQYLKYFVIGLLLLVWLLLLLLLKPLLLLLLL